MSDHLRAIRRARAAIGASRFLARAADAVSCALALAMVLAAVDATSPLAPAARLALGVASLLVLVALLARAASASRCTLNAAASRLEAALGLSRNTLVNALQLAHAETTSAVGADRVRYATRQADDTVNSAPNASVLDRDALLAPFARFVVLGAVFAIFLTIAPRVAHSAWLRFTEPFAGHPPYSRTAFEIEITPDPLLVTMDAVVTARTSLVIPETLDFVNESTGERFAMMTEGDGVFIATLERLTEPVMFHADGPTGRSRSFTITPIDRPFIERASARVLVSGEQIASVEIDLDADPPTLTPPLGATIELVVLTNTELAPPDATPGVEYELTGTRTVARSTVSTAEHFTLSLTPVSRSGLQSADTAAVLIRPVAPPPGQTPGQAATTASPDASEPNSQQPGPVEQALEQIRAQIEQMTDEQLAEQAQELTRQIDELLAHDAETPSEQQAQATLSTIREALADLVEGVPGSSDRARDASQTSEEEPPPSERDEAERGDPSSDRDRLVTDDLGAVEDDGTPPPARLEGDTLVLEGGPSEVPIRVTLEGAARDLYASLSDRERAIVARYFRELARRDANRESTP